MSWDFGLNLRATSGYVTDEANETYLLGDQDTNQGQYPITRLGVTFGWDDVDITPANRDASVSDKSLAGDNHRENYDGQHTLRVDLPAAGTYNIRCAVGTMSYGDDAQDWELLDDATSLFLLDNVAPSAGSFYDANGNLHTAANWPGSNTARQVTFATTIAKVRSGPATNYWYWAHVSFSQVGGALPPLPRIYAQAVHRASRW